MKKILFALSVLFAAQAFAAVGWVRVDPPAVRWFGKPEYVDVGGIRHWSPTDAECVEDGWVACEYGGNPADAVLDYSATPPLRDMTQEELDARQAEADAAAAQAAAEAAAAHQAHFEALVPMATVYRVVMERNFGTGACTNRTVTETYVTTYFSTKLALGTITSLESSDSLFLLANTPKIMEFTGDGTIWSFPWSQVPEPGQ